MIENYHAFTCVVENYHLDLQRVQMKQPKDKNNFNQYIDMEKKIRQKIELNAKGKTKLAKTFGVTVQNVSQALLFKRNSVQACKIREAALKNGASLVQIVDVTDEVKRAVKILDAKGNVKAVIKNETVTL